MEANINEKPMDPIPDIPNWDEIRLTSYLSKWMDLLSPQDQPIAREKITTIIQGYITQYREGVRDEGPVEAVLGTYRAMDEMHQGDWHPEKEKISCRRGCSNCCHINVDISEHEAITLLHYVRAQNITLDLKYLRGQADLPNRFQQGRSPLYSACVFLKNNECSIYEARPIACRLYHVASNPKYCDTSRGAKTVKYIFALNPEILASAIYTEVDGGPMAKMLLWAMGEEKKLSLSLQDDLDQTTKVYLVYDHPPDYPDCYVVVRDLVSHGGKIERDERFIIQSKDLEILHKILIVDMGLAMLAPMRGELPGIIETYI